MKKEDLKKWAIEKWYTDRMASIGARMDAIDGMGKPKAMTMQECQNTEMLRDDFWEGENLETAWLEYQTQKKLDQERLSVALRLRERFGHEIASDYVLRLYYGTYSRFGSDLLNEFYDQAYAS